MLNKVISLLVVAVLLHVSGVGCAYARSKEEKETHFADKVKQGISKLGTGPDARVDVKLRDKRKLKGYISEAGADSFVIVEEKTRATSTVTYSQVQQVKGNNLSTAAKVAIGVGVILLPIIVALIFVSTSD